MNPHAAQPISIGALARSIWNNHQLILQMARRDVVGRYKGSIFGLAWSFFNPIFMLVVYTFVFSVVFKSRWGSDPNESKTQFAVILFMGMIVHGLFSEILNKSSGLILANANYVKRVVFPLEILPMIEVYSALFHSIISLTVLTCAFFIFNGYIHWTMIFLPLVFLPLIFLTLGLSWFLAALGTFVRDMGQTVAIITMVMMFMSPVFYPVSRLPKEFQVWLLANPLTFIIEQAREVMIWGRLPNFEGLFIYWVVALFIAWLGFVWFQKMRKGFADVL